MHDQISELYLTYTEINKWHPLLILLKCIDGIFKTNINVYMCYTEHLKNTVS